MPTYEYKCTKCGNLFEEFQPITAATLKGCPKCNGEAKRLISAGGGFIFKGKGFHSTDYRSSEYMDRAKKECPAAAGAPQVPPCASCPGAPHGQ